MFSVIVTDHPLSFWPNECDCKIVIVRHGQIDCDTRPLIRTQMNTYIIYNASKHIISYSPLKIIL